MSEKRQCAALLALGLIAMSADSPNTALWFLLSIFLMVVIFIVPMPRMRETRLKMPRNVRGVHSVPGRVPATTVHSLREAANRQCGH